MKRYVKGNAETLRHQVFRYGVGGNAATVVDFTILTVLTEFLKLHYMASAVIAFSFSVIVSYLFNVYWVFHKRRFDRKRKELPIFFLISLVGLILTTALLFFFTEKAHIHYLESKIYASFLVFFWNFTARKYLLFNH